MFFHSFTRIPPPYLLNASSPSMLFSSLMLSLPPYSHPSMRPITTSVPPLPYPPPLLQIPLLFIIPLTPNPYPLISSVPPLNLPLTSVPLDDTTTCSSSATSAPPHTSANPPYIISTQTSASSIRTPAPSPPTPHQHTHCQRPLQLRGAGQAGWAVRRRQERGNGVGVMR